MLVQYPEFLAQESEGVGGGNTGMPPAKPQATGNKPPRAFPFALPAGSAAPLQGVFATILFFATARGRGAKATKTSTGALPRNPPTALATSLPLAAPGPLRSDSSSELIGDFKLRSPQHGVCVQVKPVELGATRETNDSQDEHRGKHLHPSSRM